MRKRLSNKMDSYERILGVLENHKSIYDSVPVYTTAVDSFKEIVAEIVPSGSDAQRDTTGKTKEKDQLKEDLSNFAVALSSAAMMYAYDIEDFDLQSALEFSYSDLRYGKDSDTLLDAVTIESELLNLKDDLLEYNVTEEDLARLQELIAQFDVVKEVRGGIKSDAIAANWHLGVVFGRIDNLLKQKIDKMVWRYKFEHPKFFVAYQAARMIVDL